MLAVHRLATQLKSTQVECMAPGDVHLRDDHILAAEDYARCIEMSFSIATCVYFGGKLQVCLARALDFYAGKICHCGCLNEPKKGHVDEVNILVIYL